MDPSNLLSLIFDKLSNPFLQAFFVIWLIWSVYVFWGLKNDGADRSRFLNGMQFGLAKTYRLKLSSFLNYTAKRWFKDEKTLEQRRLDEGTKNTLFNRILGVDAFTTPLYDFNLRLSLLYLVVSVFLIWLYSGEAGKIGEVVLFVPVESDVHRLISAVVLCCISWAFYRFAIASGWKKMAYFVASAIAIAIVIAIAGVTAGATFIACAVFVAIPGSGAFAIAVAIVGAITVTITGAIAILITTPIASAIAIAWDWLGRSRNSRLLGAYYSLFTLFYLVISFSALLYLAQQADVKPENLSLLIFLSLLPLLNAPLDWFSLGVTRSLLYAIVDQVHGGIRAFLWALFDVVMAFAFLFLITLVVVSALSMLNGLSLGLDGAVILNVPQLITSIQMSPASSEYWWIYFMLLSTLVPTMVHLFIASWSLFLWLPQHWAGWATSQWRYEQLNKDTAKFMSVWFYWVVFAPLALVAPLLMFYALYLGLHEWGNGYSLGADLLALMHDVAIWIESGAKEWGANLLGSP